MVINPTAGVYIPIIRIPVIKGWMSLSPKKRDNLDHGTYMGNFSPLYEAEFFPEATSCLAGRCFVLQETKLDGKGGGFLDRNSLCPTMSAPTVTMDLQSTLKDCQVLLSPLVIQGFSNVVQIFSIHSIFLVKQQWIMMEQPT